MKPEAWRRSDNGHVWMFSIAKNLEKRRVAHNCLRLAIVGLRRIGTDLVVVGGNPVNRKVVENPEDWKWSSFRHYASGEDYGVEIEPWRNRSAASEPIIAN